MALHAQFSGHDEHELPESPESFANAIQTHSCNSCNSCSTYITRNNLMEHELHESPEFFTNAILTHSCHSCNSCSTYTTRKFFFLLSMQEVRADAPVVAIIVANAALPIILRAVRRVILFLSILFKALF